MKNYGLYLILFLFGFLGIKSVDFNQLYSPDSAEFSILAKGMVEMHSYNDISHPQNPPHTKYPFGYPLLLVPAALLFDEPFAFIIACKITTLIIGFLALIGIYLLFDRNIWVSLLTAFTPVFLLFSSNVMSEVPLLCVSVWGIYFVRKILDKWDENKEEPIPAQKNEEVEKKLNIPKNLKSIFWDGLLLGAIVAINYYVRGNGITLLPAVFIVVILFLRKLNLKKRILFGSVVMFFTAVFVSPWVFRDITLSKKGLSVGENYISQILTPFENPFQGKLNFTLIKKRVEMNVKYYFRVLFGHIFPLSDIFYSGIENYIKVNIDLFKFPIFFLKFFIFLLFILGLYFQIKQKNHPIFIFHYFFSILLLIFFTYRQHRYVLHLIPFTYYFIYAGFLFFNKLNLKKVFFAFVCGSIFVLNFFCLFFITKYKDIESPLPFLSSYIKAYTSNNDNIMSYPYIYIFTNRRCAPFDPKSVNLVAFEYVLIRDKIKLIIADAWLDNLTEFDTLIYSSRLFDFKKKVSVANTVVYEVINKEKGEIKKRIAEEKIDFSKIIFDYEQSYEYLSGIAEFHNTLGYFYYRNENYARAIEEFKKAVELSPDDHIFHFNLGTAYLADGQYLKALEEYEIVRQCEFGYTLQHILNKNTEIAVLKQNLEIDPKQAGNAYTYFELAKFWYERGNYKKAIKELETAIKLSPNFDEARILLAMNYQAVFEYNKAKKIYKEILKKRHDHYVEFLLEKLNEMEKLDRKIKLSQSGRK